MGVTYSTIQALSQPEAMAQFLSEQVIGPVLPSLRITEVKAAREGRRYEVPKVLWNTYRLKVELPGGTQVSTLVWTKAYFQDGDCQDYRARIGGLLNRRNGNPLDPRGHARFFPELNLFVFFFPTDPVFPRLGAVFDPETMKALLAQPVAHLDVGAAVRSLECVRVKYLPEIACLVRYDAAIGRDRPLAVYGKIQHSRRGQLTYDVMRCLWDLPARADGELVLAEPLGYYPEYDLLLQSALPGEEVKRESDFFLAQCEAAGRAIAHFHNSGITGGPSHSIESEMDKLRERLEQFKMSSPQLYLMVRDLLTQVAAKAGRVPSEELVPSHGDFKYNQFLFDGQRFGLLDVEYFTQAEPSFDLGKYCGHLAPSSPKDWSDTARANEGRRSFLDAYRSARPEYRGGRFSLYESLSLATRTLVVMWGRSRNWQYTAETLIALAFERLKTRWGE